MRTPFFAAPLLACSLALAALSVTAKELPDVLETPSMATDKAPTSLVLDIARVGSRLVAVGERGHIIYSDDNGANWTQANVPVSVALTAVYFSTERHGWAVGHGSVILHSSDGGANWEKQFDGNLANDLVIERARMVVEELEAELETAAEDAAADIEFELEEATFVLEDAEFDATIGPAKPLLDVWFRDENYGIAVGAYGFIFVTEDGGDSWDNYQSRIDNPNRFHYNAIAQVTGGALFIVGEAGQMFRSVDEGENWELLESPYEGSFFGVLGTENVNEVLVFGLRGNLFRSDNLGRSWKAVDSNVVATLAGGYTASDGRIVIVGSAGAVIVSGNDGKSFRSTIRNDRVGLSSVASNGDEELVLVGEAGVIMADPNGRDI